MVVREAIANCAEIIANNVESVYRKGEIDADSGP